MIIYFLRTDFTHRVKTHQQILCFRL